MAVLLLRLVATYRAHSRTNAMKAAQMLCAPDASCMSLGTLICPCHDSQPFRVQGWVLLLLSRALVLAQPACPWKSALTAGPKVECAVHTTAAEDHTQGREQAPSFRDVCTPEMQLSFARPPSLRGAPAQCIWNAFALVLYTAQVVCSARDIYVCK